MAQCYSFLFIYYFFIVVGFVIHWNESAMGVLLFCSAFQKLRPLSLFLSLQAPEGSLWSWVTVATGLPSRCCGSQRIFLNLFWVWRSYGTLLHFLGVWYVKDRAGPSQGWQTWMICHHEVYISDQIPSPPVITNTFLQMWLPFFYISSHFLTWKSCRLFEAWRNVTCSAIQLQLVTSIKNSNVFKPYPCS